jgi:hypothetical protein
MWPDALIPDTDEVAGEKRNAFPFNVPANENRVIWVEVLVPQNATAGTYTGSVTVTSSDAGSASVPVSCTVWAFTLPSTASLRSIFGLDYGTLPAQHGVTCCATLTSLRQLYEGFALDHRISLPGLDDGMDNIAWIKQQYGGFMDGTAPTRLSGAKLTALQYLDVPAGSYAVWVDSCKKYGWFDRLFHYTCDEPPNGCAWTDIPARAGQAKAADPQFRTLVTGDIDNATKNNVLSSIDLITPVINYFYNKPGQTYAGLQLSKYSAFTSPGDIKELWLYQSCMSQGCSANTDPYQAGWVSYMIDHTAMRNRAMEWLSFQWGVSGELYWGTCFAYHPFATNDPWTNQWYYGGNGDGTLLYPGTPAKIGGTRDIPVASIRLKMIREGYEDYEYLKLLSDNGDSTYARQLAARLFPNPWTQPAPAALFAARDSMASHILKLNASVRYHDERGKIHRNESFFVYNPLKGYLVLDANKVTGESGKVEGNLRISDILGRTIFSAPVKQGASLSFEMPRFPAGIYYANVLCGGSEFAGKFVMVR